MLKVSVNMSLNQESQIQGGGKRSTSRSQKKPSKKKVTSKKDNIEGIKNEAIAQGNNLMKRYSPAY